MPLLLHPLHAVPPAPRPNRVPSSHPHPAQTYKPLMPPRSEQALWQGGMLVFDGPRLMWAHADQGTAAHADLAQVVAIATKGL